MAHHKSALKRIRQTERRTEVNRVRRSRIRTFIKKVESALEAGDLSEAQTAFKLAEPEIMRGVSKGVIKRETASRKVSRLAGRVKTLGSAPAPDASEAPKKAAKKPAGGKSSAKPAAKSSAKPAAKKASAKPAAKSAGAKPAGSKASA